MRRRLEIARGLLHKPKVIFLDEPTLGLDPSSREVMWEYIKRLVNEEKITIILTTHYMEEADILCNRIGFLDRGKIIALNSPLKLKEGLGGDLIHVKLDGNGTIGMEKIISLVQEFDFVHHADRSTKAEEIIIYVDNANRNLPVILKYLNDEIDAHVLSVNFKRPTLNDVFLKFTGRHITDQQNKEDPEGGFMERYAQYGKK